MTEPKDGLVKRDARGRVLPGQTLNPGGRPRAVRELLSLARSAVPRALELAVSFVEDERLDARVRLEAAKLLVSYGLGSPPRAEPEDDFSAQLRAMSTEELERLYWRSQVEADSPPAEIEE